MPEGIFEALEAHDLRRLAGLLAAGADPGVVSAGAPHWRPLHAAIDALEFGGSLDALILLLRAGAPVDGVDKYDTTPLLTACFRENRDAVKLLLAAGANAAVIGDEGDSPLRSWVALGDHEMVELLLASGATVTINEPGGPTGMHALGMAADLLDRPMVELLLAYGADPLALDADYRTALQRLPKTPGREDDRAAIAALLTP
jgi:uncharacterized protein